jgi:DNA-binding LytR/AlgR family response regulator
MLNTIIIEDEEPARQHLLYTLSQLSVEIQVNGMFNTVKDSIQYLSSSPVNADIILSDVQLPDGLSFDIFSHTQVRIPVIFITGYDEFVMNAFEYNGIDYLLKPVSKPELEKALGKYKMLEKHFAGSKAVDNLARYMQGRRRSRMVVRRGFENIVMKLEDIVFFYTENKIVFVVDKAGKKYMADKNLTDLEEELDNNIFFRANRQYIININYVKGYKTYEKVKLQVDLTIPELNNLIVISQETAPMFRKWMYEA